MFGGVAAHERGCLDRSAPGAGRIIAVRELLLALEQGVEPPPADTLGTLTVLPGDASYRQQTLTLSLPERSGVGKADKKR